jgi:murein DD-endopeptidase MepM/ murein hydrolase activator NlpD
MSVTKNKLQWLFSALRNDAKFLIGGKTDKAPQNAKAMLIGVGVFLGGALALSSFASNTEIPQEISTVVTIPDPPVLTAAELYDFRDLSPQELLGGSTKSLVLKSGQSLGPLLQKNGINPNTAYAVTQAFSKAHNPRDLRAGQKINLYFGAGGDGFSGISLKPNAENTIFVTRARDGKFASKKIAAEFTKTLVRVDAAIENSLYLDAQALGAPDKVIVQFSHIYAHSVDFQRDIRPGDKFEMMFEVYRDHRGKTIKAGNLVYTSFSPRGKQSEFYLFENAKGREGYYDAKGKGAKRMLMRTPVNGARLSSRFGRRKHPVLGYRKSHTGVDFAAPRGTPIMAAGTGTIIRANRFSTYGNYVSIRHSDGYVTAYAHMKGFARGAKKGRRVVQGQIIGYVGTTGRSTGPHLHYEVHKKGRKINPMTLSTLSGKPLLKADRPAFKKRMAEIIAEKADVGLAVIREPVQIADVVIEATPGSEPSNQ